jgi:hypothetical protein
MTNQPKFDYRAASNAILADLKRDRDRQVIAKRFGFDLAKRQTLEKIGQTFDITRERVRQIEKSTLQKLAASKHNELKAANDAIVALIQAQGGVAPASEVAEKLGAKEAGSQAYVMFLATLAPDVLVVNEDDNTRAVLALSSKYDAKKIHALLKTITQTVREIGKPVRIQDLHKKMGDANLEADELASLAKVNKHLANLEKHWGLLSWPQVNPKSIRDKAYLVLTAHGKPLHFTEIADKIKNSNFRRRDVTTQAVHNELIKDKRFILIGRGIYALAEWGYTPGTVADIIAEVLKHEAPLHKDEIIKRVLVKRQVRTTTIVLNLQEKNQFVRVAKATYTLKEPTA